jgi:hypothetical protein
MAPRLTILPLLAAAALGLPSAAVAAVPSDVLPPEQQPTAPRLVVRTSAQLTGESAAPLLPAIARVAKAGARTVTVTCTGAVGTRCALDAFPGGTAARSAGAAKLGRGSATIGALGTATVRVKLTAAGRRVMRTAAGRGTIALRGTATLKDGTSLPLAGSARLS